MSTIFFPNEREAAYYTGFTGRELTEDDFFEMTEIFRGSGIKNVIIKAGADGCYVNGQEGRFHLPALPVEVVDSTGAGDNFIAGFASELLRGSSCEDALRFANACGGICTTMIGAGTALKHRAQVLNFMEEQKRLE